MRQKAVAKSVRMSLFVVEAALLRESYGPTTSATEETSSRTGVLSTGHSSVVYQVCSTISDSERQAPQ